MISHRQQPGLARWRARRERRDPARIAERFWEAVEQGPVTVPPAGGGRISLEDRPHG